MKFLEQLSSFDLSPKAFIPKNTDQLLKHSCCINASALFSVNLNLVCPRAIFNYPHPIQPLFLPCGGGGGGRAEGGSVEEPNTGPGCSCGVPKLLPPAPGPELLALNQLHVHSHLCRHTSTEHTHTYACTHTNTLCGMVTRHHSSQEIGGTDTKKQGHLLSAGRAQEKYTHHKIIRKVRYMYIYREIYIYIWLS